MTSALVIAGVFLLAVGAAFYWLNLNSPVQTRIPAFALPSGAALLIFGLGRLSA